MFYSACDQRPEPGNQDERSPPRQHGFPTDASERKGREAERGDAVAEPARPHESAQALWTEYARTHKESVQTGSSSSGSQDLLHGRGGTTVDRGLSHGATVGRPDAFPSARPLPGVF